MRKLIAKKEERHLQYERELVWNHNLEDIDRIEKEIHADKTLSIGMYANLLNLVDRRRKIAIEMKAVKKHNKIDTCDGCPLPPCIC